MAPPEKSDLFARVFVIVALAVAAWAMVFKTGVVATDEAGILLYLPERIENWTGVEILFCSARDCRGQYLSSQLGEEFACRQCGARLDTMTWGERTLLPDDTGLVRKFYTRPGRRDSLHATIVLSGDDRSSIHRPQVCMTAAGHEIVHERIIHVPIEGRPEPLDIMVMDMIKPFTREDGVQAAYPSYYAYWFVGKDRETASHVARMVYMAYDRIAHGVSHRWAYIALAGDRIPLRNDHLQTIADFASQLHPALLKPQDSGILPPHEDL